MSQLPASPELLRATVASLHDASFAWALQCCGRDSLVAEEVLQDAYLKILDGRARFAGRSSFKTWLLALIRNTALDECRRTSRRQARFTVIEGGLEVTALERAPDLNFAEAETRDSLREVLAGLPERQREVLTLVFYHDLTLDEAAGVLGLAPGTARTHYERGKQALRKTVSRAEMLP
jgi:RNA polymerase sigma-70 factor (ECF subfamily)